jgi:hypothetical protein
LAAEVDGVLVTSPRADRELHLVADGRPFADPLRQALGRLIVTTLGAGAVPDLWAVGFADFLTRPGDARATGVARLRAARDGGSLHPWSDMAAAGGAFLDPSVTYPQALAVVTFLAERGGTAGLRSFLVSMGKGLSAAQALEEAYGTSAADLEDAWRAWLDGYFDGNWRRHPLYPLDTAEIEALIAGGRHHEALDRARSAAGFAGVDDPALGADLALAAERAAAFEAGRSGVSAAARALRDGDYAQALSLADAAAAGSAADAAAAQAAAELSRRARIGLAADADLRAAKAQPLWLAPLGAVHAVRARAAYAELDSDSGASAAEEEKARFDLVLAPLGVALVALGTATLSLNIWRRRRDLT